MFKNCSKLKQDPYRFFDIAPNFLNMRPLTAISLCKIGILHLTNTCYLSIGYFLLVQRLTVHESNKSIQTSFHCFHHNLNHIWEFGMIFYVIGKIIWSLTSHIFTPSPNSISKWGKSGLQDDFVTSTGRLVPTTHQHVSTTQFDSCPKSGRLVPTTRSHSWPRLRATREHDSVQLVTTTHVHSWQRLSSNHDHDSGSLVSTTQVNSWPRLIHSCPRLGHSRQWLIHSFTWLFHSYPRLSFGNYSLHNHKLD